MTLASALRDGSTDRRIKGLPRQVLLYLHAECELGKYHDIQHWALARSIGADRRNVRTALARLIQFGYVRQGRRGWRNVQRYMVLAERDEFPRCEAA